MSFLRQYVQPTSAALLRRWMRSSAISRSIVPEHSTQALKNVLSKPDRLKGDSPSRNLNEDAPEYRLYAQCNHNNAIFTLTNATGNVIAWTSGGQCGFKGAQKASYEAGYQCSVRIFQKITEIFETNSDYMSIHVFLNGRGRAREALQKALTSTEGEKVRPFVQRLTDRTPIKIGGVRAQKARRL